MLNKVLKRSLQTNKASNLAQYFMNHQPLKEGECMKDLTWFKKDMFVLEYLKKTEISHQFGHFTMDQKIINVA